MCRSGHFFRLATDAVVSLLLSAAVFPGPTLAQDEDLKHELEEEFELMQLADEEITSAAKHRQKIGFSPSAVIVINRNEIEASGSVLLTELLRRWPLFHVFDFDPLSSNMTVRFMYRVLLLIDGREVNHELFVSPLYHTIPIDLNELERIEVVLGPSSAIYGANAVSAVVNLITRRPPPDVYARANLRGGEHGAGHMQLTVSAKSGRFSLAASGGGTFSDSWMMQGRPELSIWRSLVRAEYQGEELQAGINAGFSRVRGSCYSVFGSMYFPAVWIGHAEVDLKYREFSLRSYWYSLSGKLDLDVGLYYPPLQVALGQIPVFDTTGHTFHNEIQYNLKPWAGNFLVLGADTRYTRYHARQWVDDTVWEMRAGAYFHDEQQLGEKVLLQAGLRYDWNSRTDQALSPRGAFVYNPVPEHYLRLSGGMAFRKPSMLETAMNMEVEANPIFPEVKDLFEKYGLSNPDLKNELFSSVELGWRASWLQRRLNTSLDAYVAFNRRIIAFFSNVVFDHTALGPRLNLEKSRIGFEAGTEDTDIYGLYGEVRFLASERLEVFLRLSANYAFFVDQGYRKGTYFPSLLAATGLTLFPESSWHGSLVLAARNSVKRYLRPPDSIFSTGREMSLPACHYVMLSLGRSFDAGPLKLLASLNFFNVFNNRFREEPGTVRADGSSFGGEIQGRRFVLGLQAEY